ncbi:MAG: APC family permease [Gemmatimonadaceae bacterium]|nr:APC family permease [Gemmatimonadaceae bacterium]
MQAHSDSSAPAGERGLARAIGVWGLSAAIFNTTVGGGIFRLPGSVTELIGPAAPLVYVVCAICMGLIVLCFAEAGSRVSMTGGPYAYVELVFGPYAGFMSGVLLWLLGTTAVASVSSAYAGFVGTLIPALGTPIARALVLAVTFAFLAGVNIRGVRQGARLISVVAVAKLVPLLVLVAVGALAVAPANLAVEALPAASSFARTAIVLIFAFTGVESALVPGGEMKDPSKTVPRAIAIAMIGVTGLYLAVHLVAQGVLGPEGLAAAKAAPLAAVAERLMGAPGRILLLIGAAISTFGYVSGMTLAVPRALFAFARDGFLPAPVMRIHPTFQTPWIAIVLQSVVVCALAIGNEFEALAVLANLSALLLYFACAVAGWELRRRGIQNAGTTPMTLPGGPAIHILTCVVITWLLTSITASEWRAVAVVLAVATVLFFFRRRVAPVAA